MKPDKKLLPIESFEHVIVAPYFSKTTGKPQASGPIWPNWDNQINPRHCRNGNPYDDCPDIPDEINLNIKETLVWGGFLHPHFGHFVSEHSTRILQTVRYAKDLPVLFGSLIPRIARSGKLEHAPGFFTAITDWYGLDRKQIRFFTEPALISRINVAPQAEQLVNVFRTNCFISPAEEYLDLLDENADRNRLKPKRSEKIFVSRSAMPAENGGHAASQYIDVALGKLGVSVFFPEKHPLVEQLEVYAGADELIFAEGSAVHVLQLLGKNKSSVSILNRRNGGRIAANFLTPRCRDLSYINAVEDIFCFRGPNGALLLHLGIAVFKIDLLFSEFARRGIDLSRVWNKAEYSASLEESLKKWIVVNVDKLSRRGFFCEQKELIESLREKGFDDVATFAKAYINKFR